MPPPQPWASWGELGWPGAVRQSEQAGTPSLDPAGLLGMGMPHTHLCTVWEATRKDMRSPPFSCCPATREPPTNRVPRTMPAW